MLHTSPAYQAVSGSSFRRQSAGAPNSVAVPRFSMQRCLFSGLLVVAGLWLLSLVWGTQRLPSATTTTTTTNGLDVSKASNAGQGSTADAKKASVEAVKATSGDSPCRPVYGIMVDAGSTGSRIHVYRFRVCGKNAGPELEDEVFEQLKPGLSHYARQSQPPPADFAEQAARSLDPLLEVARKSVPKHMHSCTPIAVKATAGLRLLPGNQADLILKAVEQRLETIYPFTLDFRPELDAYRPVSILDGRDEALFAWVTVNSLLNRFQNAPKKLPTAAIMDLGGGSTQIVFEPTFQDPSEKPDTKLGPTCKVPPVSLAPSCGRFFESKSFGKHEYVLYQHSYLGFGLMEARKQVKWNAIRSALSLFTKDKDRIAADSAPVTTEQGLALIYHTEQKQKLLDNLGNTAAAKVPSDKLLVLAHPCLAAGHSELISPSEWSSDKNSIPAVASIHILLTGPVSQDAISTSDCPALTSQIFNKTAPCTYDPPHCSFNGIYQPPFQETFTVYAFSYFYDRTRQILDLEVAVTNPDSSHGPEIWFVSDFKYLGNAVCNLGHEDTAKSALAKLSPHLLALMRADPGKIQQRLLKALDPQGSHRVPELCLDLSFMYHLFTTGYGMLDSHLVIVEKKIQGFETGWCLGATLEMLEEQTKRGHVCR